MVNFNYSEKMKMKQKYTTTRDEEIASLEKRIRQESPARGYAPPLGQKVEFRTLPISEATLQGLSEGEGGGKRKKNPDGSECKTFVVMTDIQHACIPHALAGRDILGAAKTGAWRRNLEASSDSSFCITYFP
jgi:ATP-dependent RNA helicase DDX10/DBP4